MLGGGAVTPDMRGELAAVREIAQSLRHAQRSWGERPVADRCDVLARWGEELYRRRPKLVEALRTDTGRTGLSELEVDSVAKNIARCSQWARELLEPGPSQAVDGEGIDLYQIPEPLGLVGVISPWNFPLQLALIDAVPALLAGCAILLKPSELTPGFVPILGECIAAVPELAAVLRIVEGGPDMGRAVVDCVDAVCFTGSVRSGRDVGRRAAERFVPAYLELGGKDPAIVCASADLDLATSAVLWGSTANAGQSCMSIERVYVAAEVAEHFVDLLVSKASRLTLDVGADGSGDISRFIDPRQAEVVASHICDAVARGARVRCGGEVESVGGNLFLRPTVLTGVDATMRVMTEETFGPVLPVVEFQSEDDAVALANSTDYGLSAAVFGHEAKALAIAQKLQAGGISINDVLLTGLAPVGEKQAFKLSGLGPSRMGPSAVSRFVRRRIALVRRDPQLQPWWYGEAAHDTR